GESAERVAFEPELAGELASSHRERARTQGNHIPLSHFLRCRDGLDRKATPVVKSVPNYGRLARAPRRFTIRSTSRRPEGQIPPGVDGQHHRNTTMSDWSSSSPAWDKECRGEG